jgi:hypothetical protein
VATGTPASQPSTAPTPIFASNLVSASNSWIHFKFEFMESFDIATRVFGATRSVAGLRQIVVDDIDSNEGIGNGSNFTEVAGLNAPILPSLLGSALEEAGFIDRGNNFAALPTTADGFNYVRMQPTGPNGDDWLDAANVPASASEADKAAVRAVFDATGLGDGFELIYGSTSNADFFENTRGWNVSLVVDPAPVPVPASLPLLLGAIAGVAWLKRRRRED